MRHVLAAALFALSYLAGCGEVPRQAPEAGAAPEKITGRKMADEIERVTSALFYTYRSWEVGSTCHGAGAWDDPGTQTVHLFTEWTADASAGYCFQFGDSGFMQTGGWSSFQDFNFGPFSGVNDAISSFTMGSNTQVELYDAAYGGGTYVKGTCPNGSYICNVDIATNYSSFNDVASSMRLCRLQDRVSWNGELWCPF